MILLNYANILDMSDFQYQIKKSSRAKNLRLVIYPNGKIVITQPRFVSDRQVARFIKSKSAWLANKKMSLQKNSLKINIPPGGYTRHKARARLKITQQVEEVNNFYGFVYQRIAIRDTKTRWGSCSGKKNLNFSYQLYFLPEELLSYVVTHELCHLQEMNHSKDFWQLVAQTIPDFRERRRELKKYVL